MASQFPLTGHLLSLVLKDSNRRVLHVDVLKALRRRLEEDARSVGALGGPRALRRGRGSMWDNRINLRFLNFLELTLDGFVDYVVVLTRRGPLLALEDPFVKAFGVGAEGTQLNAVGLCKGSVRGELE